MAKFLKTELTVARYIMAYPDITASEVDEVRDCARRKSHIFFRCYTVRYG